MCVGIWIFMPVSVSRVYVSVPYAHDVCVGMWMLLPVSVSMVYVSVLCMTRAKSPSV